MVAQHWEHYRSILQAQLQRLEFMRDIHNDPRWTEGRTNYFELSSIARGYLTKFQALDYKITTELMQETDSLIQRVTNLITIDEGYRSRDQNESIRRLTWITVGLPPPKTMLWLMYHSVHFSATRIHGGKSLFQMFGQKYAHCG